VDAVVGVGAAVIDETGAARLRSHFVT
jgi:hypothetical protein